MEINMQTSFFYVHEVKNEWWNIFQSPIASEIWIFKNGQKLKNHEDYQLHIYEGFFRTPFILTGHGSSTTNCKDVRAAGFIPLSTQWQSLGTITLRDNLRAIHWNLPVDTLPRKAGPTSLQLVPRSSCVMPQLLRVLFLTAGGNNSFPFRVICRILTNIAPMIIGSRTTIFD